MRNRQRSTFRLAEEEQVEEERFISGRRIVIWVVAIITALWRYIEPATGIFPGIEVSATELYWAWWLVLFCTGIILFVLDFTFHFTRQRRKAVGMAADVVFMLLIVLQIFFGPVAPSVE